MSHIIVRMILLLALWIVPTVSAQTSARDYAVAWTAGGNLYVLMPGDTAPRIVAEGRASIPRLSPDGTFVVFQRGDSLYVVGTNGTGERVLFDAQNALAELVNEDNQVSAGRRAWLDDDTLLFNTFQYNDFGGFPNNDLHIVEATTGDSIRAEIGGEFSPNPDGTMIAVAVAGFYGDFPGTVHIVEADGTNPREVMRYTAIATATEGQFAPQMQWVGVDTFRLAIPDPDLVYLDDSQDLPSTPLWQVDATTGEASQIGAARATFFGLPMWNDSGTWLTSLTWYRAENNMLALTIANGDGSGAERIAIATLGGVVPQGWVSGERLVYTRSGILYLSALDTSAESLLLDETPALPQASVFTDGVVYVVELANETYEVRAVGLEGRDPIILANTGEARPRVNAVSLTE